MNSTVEADPAALGIAFDASPIAQWAFDLETYRVRHVNPAALSQYGYSREEFLARPVWDLFHAEDRGAARSFALQPAAAGLVPATGAFRHVLRSGGIRYVREAHADVRLGGRRARLVQVFDVTVEIGLRQEREQTLLREMEARTRAETAARAKDALLATVGHELRQPLTPLMAALSVMEQRANRETGVRAREVIRRQVSVLTRIVEDLVDTARVQQRKVLLQRETVDLRRLVEEIIGAHFAGVSSRALTLETQMPPVPVWTSLDAARFYQILSNLLTNAIRHSDSGSRIWIQVEIDGGAAHLTVRDEGHGIDPGVLPRIFEPFVQAGSGESGRLGLGLAVVRDLVELHGGGVVARSGGVGKGAEFVVTLPTCEAPEAVDGMFAADLRTVAESVRSHPEQVLEQLGDTINELGTPMLVADDQFRFVEANPAAEALTGYSKHDLCNIRVTDILALETSRTQAHWRDFVEQGRQEGILVLRRKDGSEVPIKYSAITNIRPGLHLSAIDRL